MSTVSPDVDLETLVAELVSLIEGLGTPFKTAIRTAQTTVIVNLAGATNVSLDLKPIIQGAPEVLFNLPVAANTTTTLAIVNPPAAGVLAEFVLVVPTDELQGYERAWRSFRDLCMLAHAS